MANSFPRDAPADSLTRVMYSAMAMYYSVLQAISLVSIPYRVSLACRPDHARLLAFTWLNCAQHHNSIGSDISGDAYWTVLWTKWTVCFVWFLSSGAVLSCGAATQSEGKPKPCAVTLQKSLRARALRRRPQSLIDYKTYIDTKRPVAWILEQSCCSMGPDIHELVESIKSVLRSDEKLMAEAITSATFLEQVYLLLVFIRWCGSLSWPWFGSTGLHLLLCFLCQSFWTPLASLGTSISLRECVRGCAAVISLALSATQPGGFSEDRIRVCWKAEGDGLLW